MTTGLRRQSTGKRLRFEVFKRDGFTCQYCGAQPPVVVLVVDHITAVAAGGTNAIENLITACEACNQGKGDRSLGARAVRPDADLMYLATQQEIAELRRYQAAIAAWEEEVQRTVETLQDLWLNASGLDWCPSDRLLRQMLGRYGPDTVGEALLDVAPKVASRYLTGARWISYLWTVARNLAAQVGDDVGAEAGDADG